MPVMNPEDIAGLVSYIVRPESKYVTGAFLLGNHLVHNTHDFPGQSLNINGGTFFDWMLWHSSFHQFVQWIIYIRTIPPDRSSTCVRTTIGWMYVKVFCYSLSIRVHLQYARIMWPILGCQDNQPFAHLLVRIFICRTSLTAWIARWLEIHTYHLHLYDPANVYYSIRISYSSSRSFLATERPWSLLPLLELGKHNYKV